ncbi:MAG: hypothetical protein U0531_03250 [Dehalococcoidia bacterium]
MTLHGIAVNIDLDLDPFTLINPCGFAGLEMTSIAAESGHPVAFDEAAQRYVEIFVRVFGCDVARVGGTVDSLPDPPTTE